MGTIRPEGVLREVQKQGVVPAVVASEFKEYLDIAVVLYDAGCVAVELRFQPAQEMPPRVTLDAIYELRTQGISLIVGCGTVGTRERAAAAIDNGAQFLFSALDSGVVEVARRERIPVIPEVSTDADVRAAMRYGCRLVRVPLVDDNIRFQNFSARFKDVAFVPAGKMKLADVGNFLKAGAPFVSLDCTYAEALDRAKIAAIAEFLSDVEETRGQRRSKI